MSEKTLQPLSVPELIPALWRDPHTVPLDQRLLCIEKLEQAIEANPTSAGLHTCLGIAHAVNLDAYRSLDALEKATELDPTHFFAQLKLAELWYRFRALPRAEQETQKALQLAATAAEIQLARRQLQEIRKLINNSLARPTWGKSLVPGTVFLALLAVVVACAGALWR